MFLLFSQANISIAKVYVQNLRNMEDEYYYCCVKLLKWFAFEVNVYVYRCVLVVRCPPGRIPYAR